MPPPTRRASLLPQLPLATERGASSGLLGLPMLSPMVARPLSRARMRSERGYGLLELLVVLGILGIVLAGLTTAFTAALRAEASAKRRATAQENARIALARMRTDIHCASGVLGPQENPYGGFTLTLTQSPGVCPAVTTSSSGVQWCTIPHEEGSANWRLYRFLGTVLGDCDGGPGATLAVEYIAAPAGGWPENSATDPVPADWGGNLWPEAPPCPSGYLPAVAIRVNVNLDPDGRPNEGYELADAIALRNAPRCP